MGANAVVKAFVAKTRDHNKDHAQAFNAAATRLSGKAQTAPDPVPGIPPKRGGIHYEEMVMPEMRRKYDPEFREGAVRIVRETGKPIAQVAGDLGIHPGTLGNWVKKDRIERGETEGLTVDERPAWFSSSGRTPSCGWSVMSSSDPWSCGSRRRRDDRGIVHRRPEDRSWCAPREVLPVAGRVSSRWFYKWQNRRRPTPTQRRRRRLDAAVKASFDESGGTPGTYGSPRVWEDLVAAGWRVSVNTVAASMARQGLAGPVPETQATVA